MIFPTGSTANLTWTPSPMMSVNQRFRFFRNDIYALADLLGLPDEITCYNGTKTTSSEGLCILLKRFAYLCRYVDMCPRFGRSIPELCLISNEVMDFIYSNWNQLLPNLDQPWPSRTNLATFADAIHNKGAALDNHWDFVDGTVRPVARPGKDQRILYNGHKKVHSIKFQSVATPNGLVANLFGPVEGKRHDSSMLAASGLLNEL